MIGFEDEEAKHVFFTQLSADQQVAFTKFYEALTYSGFDMHVVTAALSPEGKLQIVVRVHERS